ncbi:62 kDa protein Tc-1 [Trypanosoma grayi]|uniref:62 kDa protein Tc-1 n=1 Tax=Trypanosoma grayi TaxID=71804 RepID=UPI0004F46321|nr:62 kDa protein Tc-1 [Trypanosoma grayi]KEG13730.1 62 kDa protein Tc-1 [Trypanosoma grayi]
MGVLIGRRELFAFAERYSSYRLKDYTDLVDGVVLCSLFNVVFPELRIRTASPQTHTLSQRTQTNWAALRAALDSVGIPQSLLDQDALLRGDAEKGFSALVLFYFLYHLTKRTDFSAEFATDVTEALTEFLQSIESIAALVAGGALHLSAVPLQLQEQLRILPTGRKSCGALTRDQQRKGRSVSCSVSSSDDSDAIDGRNLEKQLSFGSEMMSVDRRLPAEDARCSAYSPDDASADADRTHRVRRGKKCNKFDHRSRRMSSNSSDSDDDTISSSQVKKGEQNALDGAALQREVELQRALNSKTEECEELKMQGVQLLAQMAKLRTEATVNTSSSLPIEKDATERRHEEESRRRLELAEEEIAHLRRILQNTRQERRRQLSANDVLEAELLEDIVDTETGEVVNVHEIATLLNGAILDALRDSPRRRQEAQKLLWLIVSAYHVIETRLVTACDVAAMEWRHLKSGGVVGSSSSDGHSPQDCFSDPCSTPSTTAKLVHAHQEEVSPHASTPSATASALHAHLSKMEAEMERRQRQFEGKLADLHNNESGLRQRVLELEGQLRSFAQKAVERDGRWKSLCAALHEAERTSFRIAEAETATEVERLLAQRQSWYARVEEGSAALMQDNLEDVTTGATGGHDVCEAMQTLVQSVTQERDKLQREVASLRQEAQAASLLLGTKDNKSKLKDDIRSRLVEQREYEDDEVWFVRANARPPFTLSCPSVKQTPSPPQAAAKSLNEHDMLAPTGRNLSALLASVTPSK